VKVGFGEVSASRCLPVADSLLRSHVAPVIPGLFLIMVLGRQIGRTRPVQPPARLGLPDLPSRANSCGSVSSMDVQNAGQMTVG
jgi:hypothetical protein